MAKEYTIEQFANLLGSIPQEKISILCENAIREVGKDFVVEEKKLTPKHIGTYTFKDRFSNAGWVKTTTGLKKGWTGGQDMTAKSYVSTLPVSKGSRVYTMTISNKAKSYYKSGNLGAFTGKSQSRYYATDVDLGHKLKAGFKPILDAEIKQDSQVKGANFTKQGIFNTERKMNASLRKVMNNFWSEVFK